MTVQCKLVVAKTYDRYTSVAELHNSKRSNAEFHYGKQADSQISVAAKTGTYGGWGLSGSAKIANTEESAVTASKSTSYHRRLKSEFHYKEYWWKPTPLPWEDQGPYQVLDTCFGTNAVPDSRYTKAVEWNGGLVNGAKISAKKRCNSSHPSLWKYRVKFSAGHGMATSKARAATFSVAAALPYIDLSSQSGYSSNVKISWKFRKAGYLCGSNKKKPIKARIIYSGS